MSFSDRRRSRGNDRSNRRPSDRDYRGWMLERSTVVLVETSICRSRRSARGPESTRDSGEEKGLVEVSNRDESVQHLRPSANGSRAPEQRS